VDDKYQPTISMTWCTHFLFWHWLHAFVFNISLVVCHNIMNSRPQNRCSLYCCKGLQLHTERVVFFLFIYCGYACSHLTTMQSVKSGASDVWVNNLRQKSGWSGGTRCCASSTDLHSSSDNITPITLWEVRL
jgi:hypothetical protein